MGGWGGGGKWDGEGAVRGGGKGGGGRGGRHLCCESYSSFVS